MEKPFDEDVKKLNRKGEYKETLIMEPTNEITESIPGVNAPRLQADISVSGESSEIANLQAQINSLDARVTALENA